MKLLEKLETLIDSYVVVDLVGGASAKGKLKSIEEDFLVVASSGTGEVYVTIDKIVKVWETL
jgi:hypothetical protein